MGILFIIVVVVCMASVFVNLFILWIIVKLYTEIFKQKSIDSNFKKAGEVNR
jgi:hypothetical protein